MPVASARHGRVRHAVSSRKPASGRADGPRARRRRRRHARRRLKAAAANRARRGCPGALAPAGGVRGRARRASSSESHRRSRALGNRTWPKSRVEKGGRSDAGSDGAVGPARVPAGKLQAARARPRATAARPTPSVTRAAPSADHHPRPRARGCRGRPIDAVARAAASTPAAPRGRATPDPRPAPPRQCPRARGPARPGPRGPAPLEGRRAASAGRAARASRRFERFERPRSGLGSHPSVRGGAGPGRGRWGARGPARPKRTLVRLMGLGAHRAGGYPLRRVVRPR